MKRVEAPSYTAAIYIAGDLSTAHAVCRDFCMTGLCVTVEPLEFIYTGGAETGVRVGLINYPRFPAEPADIFAKAEALAERLIEGLCQHSASIVATDRTVWLSRRPDEAREGVLDAELTKIGPEIQHKDRQSGKNRRIDKSGKCVIIVAPKLAVSVRYFSSPIKEQDDDLHSLLCARQDQLCARQAGGFSARRHVRSILPHRRTDWPLSGRLGKSRGLGSSGQAFRCRRAECGWRLERDHGRGRAGLGHPNCCGEFRERGIRTAPSRLTPTAPASVGAYSRAPIQEGGGR